MTSIKRTVCKKCKAHILGYRPFCSVCFAPRPEKVFSVENLFLLFSALLALVAVYLA